AVLEAIRSGLVSSAHDLSHGGLALALVTSCTEDLGVEVDWNPELRGDLALFSESQSRVLLSVASGQVSQTVAIFNRFGLAYETLGTVQPGIFRVRLQGATRMDALLPEIRRAWAGALEAQLHG
ncbi:MAG: AIR synthase-related protein, partial [SAR324 cluster bacterium]|nr:AIR synthase-related protein [SAR324 cluster bacterium]